MNVVVFDTSGPCLTVAASRNEEWYVEANCVGVLKHSEHLLSFIDSVLKRMKLRVKDIDGWAIGKGPGSFTGLRLGWVTAKALRMSAGARCVGFSSLDLIAKNFPFRDGRFAVIVDAKRNRVYARFYESRAGKIKPRSQEKVLTSEGLVRLFKPRTFVFGDGLVPYRDFIRKASPHSVEFLDESTWFPKAHCMLPYARCEIKHRRFLKSSEFIPQYYRLSGAEEVWKDKKKKKKK